MYPHRIAHPHKVSSHKDTDTVNASFASKTSSSETNLQFTQSAVDEVRSTMNCQVHFMTIPSRLPAKSAESASQMQCLFKKVLHPASRKSQRRRVMIWRTDLMDATIGSGHDAESISHPQEEFARRYEEDLRTSPNKHSFLGLSDVLGSIGGVLSVRFPWIPLFFLKRTVSKTSPCENKIGSQRNCTLVPLGAHPRSLHVSRTSSLNASCVEDTSLVCGAGRFHGHRLGTYFRQPTQEAVCVV